jgi:hypothetical protein
MFPRLEIPTRNVSEGFTEKLVKRNPSLTHIEVAMFETAGDQREKNTGNYHDPTRQRGILGQNCPNAKTQSLADASGWDRHKGATSKLTRRVVIDGTCFGTVPELTCFALADLHRRLIYQRQRLSTNAAEPSRSQPSS